MTIKTQDTSITLSGPTVEEIDALMNYIHAEIMRIGDERDELNMQISNLMKRKEALQDRKIQILRAELAKRATS